MLSKSLIFVVFSALFLLSCDVHADLTRQDVLDNHQRRRSQLQKLVEDGKVQLDDHHSGRKLMETEEYEKIKKRIGLYEQKINRMGETLGEDEIMQAIEREKQRMEFRSRRREL